MPLIQNPDTATTDHPSEPHLGILLRVEAGKPVVMPLPPGATIIIIDKPTNPLGIIPLIIRKITPKRWVFSCKCGKRQFVMTGKWNGALNGCCEYTKRVDSKEE